MQNPIWEYSLAAYGRPDVAQACLRAQDELGVDVNILLYASWLASTDQRLNFSHLEGLDQAVRDWRERVVSPLRGLRRELRDYAEAESVRDAVKSLELQAEQQQHDMMWRYYLLAPSLVMVKQPLQENLALLFESVGCDRERWSMEVPALMGALRATA